MDVNAMSVTQIHDPAGQEAEHESLVACCTYDMKMSILRQLIHAEIDVMKENVNARDPMTEDAMVAKFKWCGREAGQPVCYPQRRSSNCSGTLQTCL